MSEFLTGLVYRVVPRTARATQGWGADLIPAPRKKQRTLWSHRKPCEFQGSRGRGQDRTRL